MFSWRCDAVLSKDGTKCFLPDPNLFDLGEFFVQVSIIESRVSGCRQMHDFTAKFFRDSFLGRSTAQGMRQRGCTPFSHPSQESSNMTKGQSQQFCRRSAGQPTVQDLLQSLNPTQFSVTHRNQFLCDHRKPPQERFGHDGIQFEMNSHYPHLSTSPSWTSPINLRLFCISLNLQNTSPESRRVTFLFGNLGVTFLRG